MSNPVVSVVVLTLNSEDYLARCLNSLARQSLAEFEVLVVDAGSTDGTRAIFDRYDARFRWLELPRSDMGSARNFGVRHSRGKYLMFLDSDDLYLPQKLARQVELMEQNPEVDVSYCAAWHFRTGSHDRVGRKRHEDAPEALRDFVSGRNHNLSTMCVRHTVWDRRFAFGEGNRGRYGEEWRLQLAMALGGVRARVMDDALTVVELRPDSHTTWSLQWKMKQEAIAEVARVRQQLTPALDHNLGVADILDQFRLKLLIAFLLDLRRAEAAQVVRDIGSARPKWMARAWLVAARVIPSRILTHVIRNLWQTRQDRSFVWKTTPPDVLAALE